MKRGDVVVLLVCLAAAGLLFLPRLLLSPANKLVVTASDGQLEFPLRDDIAQKIDGVLIEIKDSRARVASSPCRDQLCVKAGWLTRSGNVSVCLPQRVAIQVSGIRNQESGGVDSIAY